MIWIRPDSRRPTFFYVVFLAVFFFVKIGVKEEKVNEY